MRIPNLNLNSIARGGMMTGLNLGEKFSSVIEEANERRESNRRNALLTDLLGPALDATATPEQLRQSAVRALGMGQQDLALNLSQMADSRVAKKQQDLTEIQDLRKQRAERVQERTSDVLEESQKLVQLERAKALATNRKEDGTDETKENFRSLLADELITPEQYLKLALSPKSKNTTLEVRDVVNENGVTERKAFVINKDTGEIVHSVSLGGVPEDKSKNKLFLDTADGSALYQEAVAEKIKAEGDISRFEGIIAQSEKLAQDTGTPVPYPSLIGGVIGSVRDFAVADIAGLGDEITRFRTSLNEIQMQKALALLPRGPASDRDVQLALRASPNLKDYNEEERLAALRGMKKILEAKRNYLEGKVRWIQVTSDANAIGYELHTEIKGYDKNIQSLQENYSDAVKEIDGFVQRAIQARKNGNQEEYERLLGMARAADAEVEVKDAFGNIVKGLGYVKNLENKGRASKLYNDSLSERNIAIEDVKGI